MRGRPRKTKGLLDLEPWPDGELTPAIIETARARTWGLQVHALSDRNPYGLRDLAICCYLQGVHDVTVAMAKNQEKP